MKLSVVIPTCDRPALLKRAVASAIQNGADLCKIVIVDDGSEQVTTSMSFDGNTRVIKSSGRTGASAARNLVAQHASGEYILFLDDDDIFQNDYVKEVLETISSTAHKVGACNTSNKTFVTSQKVITKSNKLKHALFGAGMGFWIEREFFLAIGGFDEGLTIDEDTDLCIRIRGTDTPIFVSACVGVKISPDAEAYGDHPRLTHYTKATKAAETYAKTANKHLSNTNLSFADKWFLITRSARKMSRVKRAMQPTYPIQNAPIWALAHALIVRTKQLFTRHQHVTN